MTHGEVGWLWGCFKPPGGLLCWPFWGAGPGVVCCFVVYSAGRFVLRLTLCHFVLVIFSPFSIAITSLGEERAYLSAFRTFVRFVLVWICRFPRPLGVWEGLRFVIVALPGLFSYLFFFFFFSMQEFVRMVRKLSPLVNFGGKSTLKASLETDRRSRGREL